MSNARSRAVPVVGLTLLFAVFGCRFEPERTGNGLNVVLITLDTTRADHLG